MEDRFLYQAFAEPLWQSGDEPLDWLPNDEHPIRPVENRSYLFADASVEPLLPVRSDVPFDWYLPPADIPGGRTPFMDERLAFVQVVEPIAPSVPLTRGAMAFTRTQGEWIVVGAGGAAGVMTVGGESTAKG